MKRLIVIEGPDCNGKTTMASYLADAFNLDYFKTPTPKSASSALMTSEKMINSIKKDSVFDRSWLGELVYPQLFRGYTVSSQFLPSIESLLQRRKIEVLYILFNASRAWASHHYSSDKTRGKYNNINMLVAETYSATRDNFISALSAVKYGSKFVFNPANCPFSFDDAFKWIKHVVSQWAVGNSIYERCDPMYALTTWNPRERFVNGNMSVYHTCKCGHFEDHKLYPFWRRYHSITWGVGNVNQPKFIMVGEAPGMHGCGTTGIPFYFDRSGFLLRQLLFEHGIAETEYYITNISKCTPKENTINRQYSTADAEVNLRHELNVLPKNVPIIALGNTAREWLSSHIYDRSILSIRHPAAPLYNQTYTEYKVEFASLMRQIESRKIVPQAPGKGADTTCPNCGNTVRRWNADYGWREFHLLNKKCIQSKRGLDKWR